jgi:hypothetical protein
MRFRKFEILRMELSPGGPGPERLWRVHYRAIKNKKWVEGALWSLGRTEAEAKQKALTRHGGWD